jgi:hypothetical protein
VEASPAAGVVAAEVVAGRITAIHLFKSPPMSSGNHPLHSQPSLLQRLLRRYRTALEGIHNLLRPEVTVLEGTEKKTGEKLRIIYSGFISKGFRVGFPSQILRNIDKETCLGRHWLWRINGLAASNNCAFLLLESPATKTGIANRLLGGKRSSFFIPFFVRTHVRIDDLDALLHKNEHLENDLRRLRIEGFRPEVSCTPKDYRRFLENYYQSYRNSNYGTCGMDFDYDFLCYKNEAAEQYWELIKVKADEEWLAGLLFRKDSSCADAMEVGVKHGDRSLVKRGTLAASYWFFLQRAKELGYSEVSFMFSPPFPRNGVLQFKSKYRPKLSAAPSATYGLLLLPLKNDEPTQRILLDQPFFEITRNGLGVTAFARSTEEMEQVEKAVLRDIRRFQDAPPIRILVLDSVLP